MRTLHTTLGVLSIFALALIAYTCGANEERSPADAPEVPRHAQQEGDPPTARRDMLDGLREAHAAPRHPSDGQGRAWLDLAQDEEAVVRVGEHRTWKIVYEAGPDGIAVGGLVRLTVPRFWGWSPAQSSSPDYPGFTLASCDAEGVTLEPFLAPDFWAEWRIAGRPLAEGERVTMIYGDGPGGARADRYAEEESRLWISVDGDGDGWARILPDSPAITVTAGPPSELTLILPSTAEPGDTVPLRIAVLDALGSAGFEFEGEVQLAITPDGLEGPPEVTFAKEHGGVLRVDLTTVEPGVYRVLARASAGDLELMGLSNPLVVENSVAPIRWADLHGHSNLSDGTGTPAQFLEYARDVAGLDVVSLTDHDHWGMLFLDENPELWDSIRETTDRYHDPGTFVTVLGYEWTNWVHGHRHVLYFGGEGEVLSSIDPAYETPAQLWDGLRGQTALTFAHHSAGGPVATNWDYPPDPELEPVTEVVSVHGNSESPEAPYRIYSPLAGNFVRDILDRGYRLGFVGSGDSHDGHPGLAQLASPTGSGVAALLTDDLTREGVYQALRARRSYATNGDRIVLRVAIDAQPMGSVIAASEPDAEPLLYVRVIGTAPLAGVEVIRSGEVVETIDGEEVWDLATTVDLEPLRPGEYVYVRAIQTDRGTAWSSPFFVE